MKIYPNISKKNYWFVFEALVMNSSWIIQRKSQVQCYFSSSLYSQYRAAPEKQCSYFSQVQFCSKTLSWSMLHLNKSNPFVFLTARKNFTKKNEWIDIAINCFYYIYSSYISRFTAHIIFIHDHHYF